MCLAWMQSWKRPMQKPDAQAIVDEARRWVGTPFVYRMARRGVGVDCVGLIRGVAARTGAPIASNKEWRPFAAHASAPNPEHMRRGVETFLVPSWFATDVIPPDAVVGLFELRESLPMHLGIVATFEGRRTLIHALRGIGMCVEHGFNPSWHRRVNSWWKIPGVQY